MGKNILFVCTGNTCRSAMAVYLAAKIAETQFPDAGFCFDSAGVAAASGYPGSPEAVAVLREKGIDMGNHASKGFEGKMLAPSDYVVTMTAGHKRGILQAFPAAADKVFTLGELSGSNEDVQDPFCGSMETYRKTADFLEREICAMLEKLAEKKD